MTHSDYYVMQVQYSKLVKLWKLKIFGGSNKLGAIAGLFKVCVVYRRVMSNKNGKSQLFAYAYIFRRRWWCLGCIGTPHTRIANETFPPFQNWYNRHSQHWCFYQPTEIAFGYEYQHLLYHKLLRLQQPKHSPVLQTSCVHIPHEFSHRPELKL